MKENSVESRKGIGSVQRWSERRASNWKRERAEEGTKLERNSKKAGKEEEKKGRRKEKGGVKRGEGERRKRKGKTQLVSNRKIGRRNTRS